MAGHKNIKVLTTNAQSRTYRTAHVRDKKISGGPKEQIFPLTVKILNIGTDESEKTVQTQIISATFQKWFELGL